MKIIIEKIMNQIWYENNVSEAEYEIMNNGDLKIFYPGVHATSSYDEMIQGSYPFFSVIKGEFKGFNYYENYPIVAVQEILAVYDKDGIKIR